MPSPFADALHRFIVESVIYDEDKRQATHRDELPDGRALARAGDVLESELRKMMREEAPKVPPPIYVTYGDEEG